jgi:hypothetical protein
MSKPVVILMACTNPKCDSCGWTIEIPGIESHGKAYADDTLDELCEDCGKDMEDVEE